jgi:hypothetical protein
MIAGTQQALNKATLHYLFSFISKLDNDPYLSGSQQFDSQKSETMKAIDLL